jgi:hypothetical protein
VRWPGSLARPKVQALSTAAVARGRAHRSRSSLRPPSEHPAARPRPAMMGLARGAQAPPGRFAERK